MKIYVIGSINMDLTVRASQLPERGMTVTGNGFLTTPGGKGANQAVACAKLGAKTYMAGCVGNAFADELLASLGEHGVNTKYVEKTSGVSSGIAVILVMNGDNRIVLDKGANDRVERSLVDRALSTAEAGDILIVQLEIPTDTVAYALSVAKKRGMTTVLNPAPAASLDDGIFKVCDYFIPNQTEARFYTGIYPSDEKTIEQCAEVLRKKGVKNVMITLGELGSVGFFGSKAVRVPAFQVNTVDTTAAGDTYIGAFSAALCEGQSEESAMRFASAASALAVTKRGAQTSIPTRADTNAFLQEYESI